MTEEAKRCVKWLRTLEEGKGFASYLIGAPEQAQEAADMIESLLAQLEQVEKERDGLNIMLAQAQAMLETRTKERDAAVKHLGEVALCQDCAHYKHNGGDCSGELFCKSHETGFNWQWRGVREVQ